MSFSLNIKTIPAVITGLLLFSFMCACNDTSDCTTTASPNFRVSFYKKVRTNLSIAKEFDTLRLSNITTPSVEGVFYPDTTLYTMLLPTNPNADSIHFVIERQTRGQQHITVYYDNISRVISPDCGIERVTTIREVRSPELDSISIVNNVLRIGTDANIEIFL